MNTQTATEYRNLPLNVLTESRTNPRRLFEDAALKELAESIRTRGCSLPCWFARLPCRASRSFSELDATGPLSLPRPKPFPSVSSTSRMPLPRPSARLPLQLLS